MESHLLQMRGLKHEQGDFLLSGQQSHLLQMRGLKLFFVTKRALLWGRIFYRCVD